MDWQAACHDERTPSTRGRRAEWKWNGTHNEGSSQPDRGRRGGSTTRNPVNAAVPRVPRPYDSATAPLDRSGRRPNSPGDRASRDRRYLHALEPRSWEQDRGHPRSLGALLGRGIRAGRRRGTAGHRLRRLGKGSSSSWKWDLFSHPLMIAVGSSGRRLHGRSRGKGGLAAFDFSTGSLLLVEAGDEAARAGSIWCAARKRWRRSILGASRSRTPGFRLPLRAPPRNAHAEARATRSPTIILLWDRGAFADEILHVLGSRRFR